MVLKWDDAEGSATISNEAECIDYALAKGARILNISYGAPNFSQAEYDAVKRAREAGAIVVTSAGNDGVNNDILPSFPANHLLDNVLSVASTTRLDALAASSSYGPGLVDLAAPGASILTCDFAGDASYVTRSGTSFSAPLVAGVLALLKAQFPGENYSASINRLLRSVDSLPALADKVQTGGRLNLARALSTTSDRPFNDDFARRARLAGHSVTVRGNTGKASTEADEPSHAGASTGATVWFSWTAPANNPAAVDTAGSGFDTAVAVYTGDSLGTLQLVAENDDTAGSVTGRAAFAAVSGTTYHVAIGGKNGATGALIGAVGFVPANDRFADAVALTGFSTRLYGFNWLFADFRGSQR